MNGRRHSVGAFSSTGHLPGISGGGHGSSPSSPPVGQRFQQVGRMIGEEADARPPSPAFAATMPGRRASFSSSLSGPKGTNRESGLWQAAAKTQGLSTPPITLEEAGTKLREAMLSKDSSVLLEAISQARMVGFDKKEVERAVKALQRVECQEALQRSQKMGDVEGLRAAMRRARHLNFDAVLLEKPQRVLETLESQEMLEIAMRNRETGSLQACINVASSRGVNPKLIEEAKQIFSQLTAQMTLNAACKGKDADKLEDAIEKAKSVGMDVGFLSPAQDYLNYLRSQDGSTAKVENDAPAPVDPVTEILQRAIGMRETGCLRMAIQTAKNARGDHASLLQQAETMLAHVEAELLLPPAIKKQDRKKLTEAVKKAEESGLQSSLLDQAKHILAQMQGRDHLSSAMARKNSADLREAIDSATDLGLEKAKIDKAEHLFQQACIRESLYEAAEGTDADALQSAINAAKAAGIEKREVDKAEFALRALSSPARNMGRRVSAGAVM
mmetsp:Transcript_124347/g.264958  ORF Transcript_124347/g.264958 Transcript_124347/m.264958 type:complete len:501 (+) Transcript_124347:77-1579(+)